LLFHSFGGVPQGRGGKLPKLTKDSGFAIRACNKKKSNIKIDFYQKRMACVFLQIQFSLFVAICHCEERSNRITQIDIRNARIFTSIGAI
jgi:hypothetical protein